MQPFCIFTTRVTVTVEKTKGCQDNQFMIGFCNLFAYSSSMFIRCLQWENKRFSSQLFNLFAYSPIRLCRHYINSGKMLLFFAYSPLMLLYEGCHDNRFMIESCNLFASRHLIMLVMNYSALYICIHTRALVIMGHRLLFLTIAPNPMPVWFRAERL